MAPRPQFITYQEYFSKWLGSVDITEERKVNAVKLLTACDALYRLAVQDDVYFPFNSRTQSRVSGETYGGFRPQDYPIGSNRSAHKEALAVDIYDPRGDIDNWCFDHQDKLEQCGIYIEAPNKTVGWSHWTIRAPGSGKRVFMP